MTQLAYLPAPSTSKPTDNYHFLQHSFPELYRVCVESEQYYSTDPSCCLLKARLFIELWCHEVGERVGLCTELNDDLMGEIERLSASNQIPPYIIEALHEIRCEGNRSVHITKLSDGQWSSGSKLGKSKLKRVMTNIFELSQYLAFQINHQAEKVQDWLEPTQTELAEHVYASLSGNRDATFSLAQRASSLMLVAQNNGETNLEKKQQWKILQRDLSYWLERAHRQGHLETWLMYANVYLNKQLILPIGHTIDNCFKSALKVDPSGDAAYQYGVYLVKHSQCERGIEFIKKSGEMSHHKAICFLQSKYYKKDQQAYLYWLNSGIEAGEKSSFTLDLAYKLGQWELDVNNDFLKKKAKTALIAAQSRQAPGGPGGQSCK